MGDKKEIKNTSKIQKEHQRVTVFTQLRHSFRNKPETLKLSMEIANLDPKDRTDGVNNYVVNDKFLDYLKLAYEKDEEYKKWKKDRPEREDLEKYEPDGKMLEEYEKQLKMKETGVKKTLGFKPKASRRRV